MRKARTAVLAASASVPNRMEAMRFVYYGSLSFTTAPIWHSTYLSLFYRCSPRVFNTSPPLPHLLIRPLLHSYALARAAQRTPARATANRSCTRARSVGWSGRFCSSAA